MTSTNSNETFDDVVYGQRFMWPPPDGWKDRELLQPTIVTDGGPWCEHNFPCFVCFERPAIRYMDIGSFGPCDECSSKGWELVLSKRKRLLQWATGWRSR